MQENEVEIVRNIVSYHSILNPLCHFNEKFDLKL